eukprot:scaffold138901_cov18-Tisochrysis_lutea.AAC.2
MLNAGSERWAIPPFKEAKACSLQAAVMKWQMLGMTGWQLCPSLAHSAEACFLQSDQMGTLRCRAHRLATHRANCINANTALIHSHLLKAASRDQKCIIITFKCPTHTQ